MKKLLSIIIAILMIVTTIPMAFAAEDTPDFSDAKVLSTDADGYLYIDGQKIDVYLNSFDEERQLIPSGKYKLEGDIETINCTLGIKSQENVIINLDGYKWTFEGLKHLILEGELSIYDLSEKETGKLVASSSWGVVNIQNEGAVFNLYSGTLESINTYALRCKSGTVNLYGGKIKGSEYAISYSMSSNTKGLNIDDTVIESGDGYEQISCSAGAANPENFIDVSDYTGDYLTVKFSVTKPRKHTVFEGVKNAEEAEKYSINVVCDEYYEVFFDKTEYDEATGEISVYAVANAFTQQPTADNNYTVDFNNPDVSFQWCEVEEKNLGTYIAEEGRTLFSYDFKAGDKLVISTDSEFKLAVIKTGIIDTDYEYIHLDEYKKTATITFDADTTVDFSADFVDADNPVEVNFTVFKETKLDGETEKTLQKVECGKSYYCKATVGENVYVSDTVNILPVEHDLIQVDAKAPTCTEIGWDAYEYCTACTYTTYVELPVDADAHDWSNKDGICKVCSVECEHESYTEGVCDECGYECPHEETYETVTKFEHFSVQNSDGTWTKATISVVCRECESVIEYKEADRADYTEFDKYMARVDELLGAGNITEDEYNYYSRVINNYKNNASVMGSPFQETADSYADSLEYNVNEIEAGLADGTMKKADFTYMTALFDEINALIDNDPNKLIPSESGRFQGIYYGYYMSCKNNGNHSQADYDQNMTDNNWEGQIEAILAGVEDGSALKADYTIVDDAIAEIEEKFADEYLTDEGKAELEEIKSEIEKLKADPNTSVADLEGLERSVYNIFTAAEACFNGYHSGLRYELTEEAKCGKNAVESATCSSCGKVLTREVENSALTHSFTKYEETEAPKCGVEGKEVAYCDNGCGEIEVRATEALKHIPLDAVKENEVDPECEKEGSYDLVVYCDLCGGEISRETFAVDALEHLFIDYIYNEDATCEANGTKTAECVYGCGETDTVTAEDTMLNHADEDGDGICDDCETEIKDVCPDCGGPAHEETGIPQYICMLITLIKLVISLVKVLQAVV